MPPVPHPGSSRAPIPCAALWTLAAVAMLAALPVAAQEMARDTGFIAAGKLPRIESDPYIGRPTFSLEPTWTDKESENQLEFTFKYGAPFKRRDWSWQLSVPVEHVESTGKQVNGLSDISFQLNHALSWAHWRQAVSLKLTANSAANPSLGDGQREIEPSYVIGAWLTPHISTGMLLSWAYGFDVDSGRSRKNVITPRTIVSLHFHGRRDFTLDLRPRFDLTRNEFYSTLMLMMSAPLGTHMGGQAGFEFPLSQLAAKRVENSRIYIDFSYGL